MSTTTLRLPEELRVRLMRLAETEGTSAHALMVHLLAEAATGREARADFEAEAERRLRRMVRTGEFLDIADLRVYADALASGERPAPPRPRRLPKEEHLALNVAARRNASRRRCGSPSRWAAIWRGSPSISRLTRCRTSRPA